MKALRRQEIAKLVELGRYGLAAGEYVRAKHHACLLTIHLDANEHRVRTKVIQTQLGNLQTLTNPGIDLLGQMLGEIDVAGGFINRADYAPKLGHPGTTGISHLLNFSQG
jgi:hypothetical protein